MLIKSNNSIISKNLKPNTCVYHKPLPPKKFTKSVQIPDELKECCTNVSIKDFAEKLIMAENKGDFAIFNFSNLLEMACLTKVSAPKPIQFLDRQVFNLKIKINTGKNVYEFNISLKGDSVMSDGSKLTDYLVRKTKYKTTLYDFNYRELESVLVANLPLDTVSKYKNTKFYRTLLRYNKTEFVTEL